MSTADSSPPHYGIDAPGVVRNLFLAGTAGLLVVVVSSLVGWPLESGFTLGAVRFSFPIARMAGFTGAGCTAMGLWMLWSSKVGKIRDRERLLDRIPWTGAESVLDVGCGRGLLLVGAAKRLTTGTAVGIDLWQAEDLSGNNPEATRENARREGVEGRVEIKTADMRELPFPDGSFDVVVSRAAIHNIYDTGGRAKAIAEIARVLKSGGRALIEDIRHGAEYEAAFAAGGCPDVRRLDSRFGSALLFAITFGSLRPATLLATKNRT